MISLNFIEKTFDDYEIKARLIPGIMANLLIIFLGLVVPADWNVKSLILLSESVA